MPRDLVERLAADLAPVRPRRPVREASVLLLLGAIELALLAALGLMRPDMHRAMGHMSFWWKLASLGLIAVLGGVTAIASLDPLHSPRRGLRRIGLALVVVIASGWLVDAAGAGFGALLARLMPSDGLACVAKMILLSLPALVALGLLMRRGAATEPGSTALAIGIAASAWGAFVFVFACPHDDPLYIAVWYAVGCGAVTAAARLLLPRIARW